MTAYKKRLSFIAAEFLTQKFLSPLAFIRMKYLIENIIQQLEDI